MGQEDAIWLHAYSIRRQHGSGKHECYQAENVLQCNTVRVCELLPHIAGPVVKLRYSLLIP